MLKILAWFVSTDTKYFQPALKILERQHNGINLVGAVTAEEILTVDADYDVLLVVGAWQQIGMSDIIKFARQLNLPEEKLLGDWIVCIPGFELDKYRRLQRSQLSIISVNCFGGLMSHLLGLPFRTPFVNMCLRAPNYIRLLRAPRDYLAKELTLKEMRWHDVFERDYPVGALDNIELEIVHHRDFDVAATDWNIRKQRINWYNLFVMMHTEDEKILQEFDALPYGKKVCFVPFKSDLDSAWYINPEIDFDRNEKAFLDVVNNFARGKYFYYDVFDMLLYGKKTQLIKM